MRVLSTVHYAVRRFMTFVPLYTAVRAGQSPIMNSAPGEPTPRPQPSPSEGDDLQRISDQITGHLTSFAQVERLESFRLRDLFSEVFRKHGPDEIEEYFTVGTNQTTPPIHQVDAAWPKPWVFFRTLIGTLFVYFLFVIAWAEFKNPNLIPGLIIVGSFAVPLTTLIFFFEINARRNVSLYQVIRLLFLGGILSILLSLLFFEASAKLHMGWLGSSLAGLVEEPGKLLALLAVARNPRYPYKLNGLLFGAAVGAGFAAFESAGYALQAGYASDMMDTITIRGLLSPFAHIAWTAMCGAALWRTKGASRLSLQILRERRFLRIFILAVAFHMLWNCPLHLPFYGKYLILGIAAWIILLGLVQEGLRELRTEKSRLASPPAVP